MEKQPNHLKCVGKKTKAVKEKESWWWGGGEEGEEKVIPLHESVLETHHRADFPHGGTL